MSSTPTQANRLLSIETPLGDDVLLITGFSAAERISSPFEYEVEMVADVTKASSVSADALVAKKVAISLAQNDDRLEVSFQLQGASVTDKDLAPLAQLKKVAYVNLAKTSITDAGLAALEPHTGITRLHLELTKITDAGLAHLKGLQQLEYLNLYGTAVTDAGLAQLAGLKNLKNLYLWQTKVTPEGAKKLNESLPNVDINLGWETTAPTSKK